MLSRSNPSSAFTKIPPNTPTETCVLSPTVWRRRVNSAFSPTCAAKTSFTQLLPQNLQGVKKGSHKYEPTNQG